MKTMLDKCAVAGDITQAIDRRGAWSCAVTVIGGTENTAVKLQSADSADGKFTDFKTLISADEAESDQYKGFVLDLGGAGNFIKIVGATMATAVFGDCDYDVKEVAIKAGEIPKIPSGGDSGVYIWTENVGGTRESTSYLNIDKAPSATEANSIKKLLGSLDNLHSSPIMQNGYIYNHVSDTEFTINVDFGDQTLIITYTRNENVHIWD